MSGRAEPIRVTLVGPSLDILGGQAVQASRLLARFQDTHGLEVDFLPVNPRLPAPLRWCQSIKYLRTVVTSIAYLGSLLRRLPRTEVVHAFSASYWSFLLAPTPAILLGRLLGRRVVLNYHSGEAEDHLRRSGWLVIPIMRLAHSIVVPSGYLVDVFGRFGLSASAIPNHVDEMQVVHRPHEVGKPRFLSNRNLETLYDVASLLRAFARVQEDHPGAEMIVAGDGSQRQALERLSAELGLRGVTFIGPVPPDYMPRWYEWTDYFWNASRIDNMPLSILEAFAAGIPTVSTGVGGIPWIIRDGENGLLVPSDDPEAMAAAAVRLLKEPELANRLGNQARREAVERYGWEAVEREWVALYQSLARKSKETG